MAKPSAKSQETIINPETEEVTQVPTQEQPVEQTQNLKDNYETFPTPTASAGKGKKYCRNCNAVMGARSVDCPNCGYHIYKGDKTVKTGAKRFVPKQPAQATPTPTGIKIDRFAILKVLKARGYDITAKVDALDPSAKPEIVCNEPNLKLFLIMLNLSELGTNDGIQIEQTTPKIKLSMNLDTALKIFNIPERK